MNTFIATKLRQEKRNGKKVLWLVVTESNKIKLIYKYPDLGDIITTEPYKLAGKEFDMIAMEEK